jgi:DNA-binding MarR family transcriptional regulator
MRFMSDDDLDAAVDAVLDASRELVAVSARSIAGAKGVTFPQFRMLVVLTDRTCTLSELAGHLDVAPSTAMRMVDRLVTAGLVDRTVPPENRRETRIALTAAGRRTVRTVTARRRRDLQAVLERLTPTRRRDVARAMQAFADAAEQVWGASAVEDGP